MGETAYHLDFETYSEADLTKVGTYKYAAHPSTEILILAIAEGDGPVLTWDVVNGGQEALDMLDEAVLMGSPIFAHNAQFEHSQCSLLGRQFGISRPELTQWRCTAAMARRCSIQSSLDGCAKDLGLKLQKDTKGKRLIAKFSMPQRAGKLKGLRILPEDDKGEFAEFIGYCRQDVEVERAIAKKLHRFRLEGGCLEAFQFDMRMNERGIPVNTEVLPRLDELRREYDERLTAEFMEMTRGESVVLPVTTTRKEPKPVDYPDGIRPSQREACVELFQSLGYPFRSLDEEHTESFLATRQQDDSRLVKLIRTRSLVGHAAVKKIPTMMDYAEEDSRMRGQLMLWGAERTHRWAGRGSQPQNFARPVIKDTHGAYEMLCAGHDIDTIEMIYGDFFGVLKSVMRHTIQKPGSTMLQADYSAIEARIVQWVTGKNTKALKVFARGGKIYEEMAATIFGVSVDEVVADTEAGGNMRFVGKQAVLGCGFGAAAPKFEAMCLGYGQDIGKELAEKAVNTWREDNPEIASYDRNAPGLWTQLDTVSKRLVKDGRTGYTEPVGRLVLGMVDLGYFKAFCIKLPSGHFLVYPKPSVENVVKPWGKGTEIQFHGRIGGKQWGRVGTFGAKLLENAVQAIAGDIMARGAINAEREGYEAFMLVHDEIIAMKQEGQTHERLCELLCELPEWAKGLPLVAEGKTISYYLK